MKRLIALLLPISVIAACQTPGYDYQARMAPTFAQAADYRAVDVGEFKGPGGDAAERAFLRMLNTASLDGQPWFMGPQAGVQGVYSGRVDVTGYDEEERFESEEQCVDGDCDYKERVESICREQTVEVDVTTVLIDSQTGSEVFQHVQGGAATQEDCEVLGVVASDAYDDGKYEDVLRETLDPYYAPVGMIDDAVQKAVQRFRYDIAPYHQSVRAEIMKDALTPELAADNRFKLAVKATKRGEMIGACAQWNELGKQYPNAPAALHNLGACAEARGDLSTALTYYAKASEIAQTIPLLKDKKAQPIFDALKRVSDQRAADRVIDRANDGALMIDDVPANTGS
jgi:tetratricopeptide (TPR) repeat protein